MKEATPAQPSPPSPFAGSEWFDPLEEAVRGRVRSFIEDLLEEELEAALGRERYQRGAIQQSPPRAPTAATDHHFGPADALGAAGAAGRRGGRAGMEERATAGLPAAHRRAEALIAEAYLAGMNTRRVRRALAKLFEGHIGKDVVSRAWQKTRAAWQAWQERDLAGDDIVRLILDGTVVKVRLDRKATAISLLIALGIRRDGQKVVLAIRNMGGGSQAAWRAVLDDLTSRGLARPDLVIVDGGKGLEAALASLWDDVPVQRCTVHKERNLLARAEASARRDQGRVQRHDARQDGRRGPGQAQRLPGALEAALSRGRRQPGGSRRAPVHLLRYPPEQWRSLRTTNAIERLHEEFKRRIKTQCLLPCAETAAMLFWALLASDQITMRRVDGWPTLDRSPIDLDLAA